ncbi:hypothetical protein M9H77_17616 [Catharanthus roseus]|uniref:Uncharacterized protein n=1 Tax=Catharanthus roseus TaxID=4058 RepID=A0ACC0B5G1_CATRO|nr:hypothetical protein M9H77_17616 [Catharanthus roseus]
MDSLFSSPIVETLPSIEFQEHINTFNKYFDSTNFPTMKAEQENLLTMIEALQSYATADEKLGRLNNLTKTFKELHDTYKNMKVEIKVQEDNIYKLDRRAMEIGDEMASFRSLVWFGAAIVDFKTIKISIFNLGVPNYYGEKEFVCAQRIALYVASLPYEGLFRRRRRFRLERVDLLEEGRRPWRVWPNISTWTPYHALRWDGRLVESQEGLETKIGPRADFRWKERLFGNRSLIWCLASIDYEMPDLGSDDLVLGSGRCPWSQTVAFLVSRGTQIPYSAAVDLVAGLGYHSWYQSSSDKKELHAPCHNRKSSPVLSTVFDIYYVSNTPRCRSMNVKMEVSLLEWS